MDCLPSASRFVCFFADGSSTVQIFFYAAGVGGAVAVSSYIPGCVFQKVNPLSRFTKLLTASLPLQDMVRATVDVFKVTMA